jgi:DNA-binding transcriptional LysR family regulator
MGAFTNRHGAREAGNSFQGSDVDDLFRRLDLASLRMFVDACRFQSIARAAAEASVVPSAVSRRIGDLEKSVGVPLLYRSPRGITPTAAGQTVLEYATEAIDTLQKMSAALTRFSSGLDGSIRLVASLSSIDLYLPEDIAAFCRTYPEITVDIQERLGSEIVRQLESGSADLGVGSEWYLAQAHVASRFYRSDELVAVFAKSHLKAARASIRFADIVDEPLLGLADNTAHNGMLTEKAAALGATINFKIRASNFDALCRMAHAGLGVAVVPRLVADLYRDITSVALVPLDEVWARKNVLVAYRSDATLSAAARLLLEFLTRNQPGEAVAHA